MLKQKEWTIKSLETIKADLIFFANNPDYLKPSYIINITNVLENIIKDLKS